MKRVCQFGWILLFVLLIMGCGGAAARTPAAQEPAHVFNQRVAAAFRQSDTRIEVRMRHDDAKSHPYMLEVWDFETRAPIRVVDRQPGQRAGEHVLTTEPLSISNNYLAVIISTTPTGTNTNTFEIQPGDQWLDRYFSDKPLGLTVAGNVFTFRVFAPRARRVVLSLFRQPYEGPAEAEMHPGERQIDMIRDVNGVWEATIRGRYFGWFYGYRVWGPLGDTEEFNPRVVVGDPYAKAVATKQIYPQHHLTLILNPANAYRWRSRQKFMPYQQHELVIYQMHVRDMTMLLRNIRRPGTYAGLVEDIEGGPLAHLRELGVNAVQFQPTHEFHEIEAPFKVRAPGVVYNTWNVYGRNHWGYMTSFFFAPESYFLEGEIMPGQWIGTTGGQVNAFKAMVDAFHQNGMAVIKDVVYNHVSLYDRNALKHIDNKYYFFMNEMGGFDSRTGMGNDYRSCRPMSRRLIVDSTTFWVREYRIGGFRFDLGTVLDWKTYETLVPAVRAIKSNAYFTAEPWMGGRGEPRDGGNYALIDNANGFDRRGVGTWNDRFRNLVRGGANATYGARSGLLFGSATVADMRNAVLGYPTLFTYVGNSVNYIESHDNNTIADFIRIGNRDVKNNVPLDVHTDGRLDIQKYLRLATLTDRQMKQSKLGALFLFTVPGTILMHAGQEMGRMKIVVPPTDKDVFPTNTGNWVRRPDDGVRRRERDMWINLADGNKTWGSKPTPWGIDHNSYEKDNEANWIIWDLKNVNRELFQYYQGLIRMRRTHRAFARGAGNRVQFIEARSEDGTRALSTALGYVYPAEVTGDRYTFVTLINGNHGTSAAFELPAGEWNVMVDGESSSVRGRRVSGRIVLGEISGMVLYR